MYKMTRWLASVSIDDFWIIGHMYSAGVVELKFPMIISANGLSCIMSVVGPKLAFSEFTDCDVKAGAT